MASAQTIATVERAGDVLNAFTQSDGATLGVTELATRLGLSKAVVHRILSSLRVKGFVVADEETRRYSLGPAALALGLTYLQQIDVRDRARGALRELTEKTNETATLSVRRGDVRIYVDQVTPPREVKMTVQLGHPYPLHLGASSKALLAHMGRDEIESRLTAAAAEMGQGAARWRRDLERELAAIAERGYATSFGERQEGAGSVAAPVFDHEGAVIAVISVCGPVERFRGEVEAIAPILLDATQTLSRQLGWPG